MRRTASEHIRVVAREYDGLAAIYDRRWDFYIEATTEETFSRLHLRDGLRLLEVACGTGRLLAKIRDRHPAVRSVGVDLSRGMLDAAARRTRSAQGLICGNVASLPFRTAGFDVVVCSNSFHFFPEPGVGLREMRRVLRPGGSLVLTDWCDDYLWCRLCDWYLRLADPAHVRMYGSRQCRDLLAGAGFRTQAMDRYRVSWLWGLMTLRARP